MVSHGEGGPRGQQQRGVDRGQGPGADGGKGLGDAGRRSGDAASAGPDGLEVGPQQLVLEVAEHRHRVHAGPVQRAEEGGKEHDFAEDEPAHAPAEGHVDAVTVEAAFTFADGVAEPLLEDDGPPQQPEEQRIHAPAGAVDPLAGTQDDEEQANGGHHRVPRRPGNEVVRCGAVGGCGHRVFSSYQNQVCATPLATIQFTSHHTPATNKAAAMRPAAMTCRGLSWETSWA